MSGDFTFNEEKVLDGDRNTYQNKSRDTSPLINKLSNLSLFKTTEGARIFLFFMIFVMMIIVAIMIFNMAPNPSPAEPLPPPTF